MRTNKKTIITACLPLITPQRRQKETHFNAATGPAPATQITDIINRITKGEHIIALQNALTANPPLTLQHTQTNPDISIIPINYGCQGNCASCCVTHARGKLRSYTITEINERIKHDLTTNTKEIWLTSQDTASYGKDNNTNLAELLNAITNVKGNFKIRVGMMTPNTAIPFLSELIEQFK